MCARSRVADPDGFDPDPDTTLEKNPGSGYEPRKLPRYEFDLIKITLTFFLLILQSQIWKKCLIIDSLCLDIQTGPTSFEIRIRNQPFFLNTNPKPDPQRWRGGFNMRDQARDKRSGDQQYQLNFETLKLYIVNANIPQIFMNN